MPRRMKPEESLAACYPHVAATWHPERNGDRTPENTSAKNTFRAWWRCPAAHEWEEIVATRTAVPAWKKGDPAACRVCVGYHVIVTFDCGHTTDAPARFRHRSVAARPAGRCADEREAAYRESYLANSAASKKLYAECRERAEALADSVAPTDIVLEPLVYEWRRVAVHELRRAIVSEQLFGKTGMVGAVLAGQRRAASALLPSVEELQAAVARRQPLRLLGRAHWPTGWLYHLAALEPSGEQTGDVVDALRSTLTEEIAGVAARFGRDRQLQVHDLTGHLTETIASWAYGQETKWRDRRWNVYRELSLPVAPGGSTRFGRIDVTVMRPNGPDIVVEIDSAHTEQNVEKLLFARDARAIAVWVRWHGGRVEAPTGIHVLDLVEATRGLAR